MKFNNHLFIEHMQTNIMTASSNKFRASLW